LAPVKLFQAFCIFAYKSVFFLDYKTENVLYILFKEINRIYNSFSSKEHSANLMCQRHARWHIWCPKNIASKGL